MSIDAKNAANLFEHLPDAATGEVFTDLLAHPSVRVERIVTQGQSCAKGDFYDQAHPEWVLLLQGAAQLDMVDESAEGSIASSSTQRLDLIAGSFVYIPAHCRHRVHSSSEDETTVWLAIHINEAAEVVNNG